ncbi:MAG: transposase [Planctomycetes bacterium]|nr:transposase [Planctomycetota bacterium]
MREDLRRVWEPPEGQAAQRVLDDWIRRAESSGIRILVQFAHTLAAHRSGILNYYRYRISTGPLEGTNTKIRVLQRKAYGFRDREFSKLKIYGLHETRHELVGGVTGKYAKAG